MIDNHYVLRSTTRRITIDNSYVTPEDYRRVSYGMDCKRFGKLE